MKTQNDQKLPAINQHFSLNLETPRKSFHCEDPFFEDTLSFHKF